MYISIYVNMPPSWITALSWQSGLYKSMKLWAMLCRATPNEWIIMKSSDKHGPLEEEMTIHSRILASRTPWIVWKDKKGHQKMSPHQFRLGGVQYATGKSGGQLLTAPEGMKRLGQNGNSAQLWMCLVVKVRSNAVKNKISQEPGVLGPWIKVN